MIFIDTAAFYALIDARDPNHGAARLTMERLRATDASLLTHEYILVETTALIQRRLGIGAVVSTRTYSCVSRLASATRRRSMVRRAAPCFGSWASMSA